MSAAAAITGAAVLGIAAAALTPFTRARLTDPQRPDIVSVEVLGLLGAVFGFLAGARLASWPESLAFAITALVSTLLVVTDLAAHEIPHKIMWPGMLGLVVGLLLAAAIECSWARFGFALLYGVVIAIVYFVIAWFGKGQFGIGDVSLSLFFGTFLGWLGLPYALVGAVGAFLLHAVVTIGVLIARRAGRKAELPFGPSLIAASWFAAFLGPIVLRSLLHR
jgi:leader peptidase (prepilin peptidase)/N-methyltransferase